MINKKRFLINLQLFAEGEGIESSENAEPVANVEPQTTEQPETTESVKEEVATPKVDKVEQSEEENSKYATLRRNYESKQTASNSKAVDDYIKSCGYFYNDVPIETKAQYDTAVAADAEDKRQAKLTEQGIDPKIVEDYVKDNPTVKWATEFKTKQDAEQAKQAQYLEFATIYPDVKGEDISPEVWKSFNEGTPLKIAYAIQENSKLKAELAEYKKGLDTNSINSKNEVTTGSIKGQGTLPVDFVTKDVFEKNKKDQTWMNKNYELLKSSMGKW